MDQVEGILIVAGTLALAGLLIARVRRRPAAPDDPLDEVLGAAHDGIDEIELARVRSMLQRR